MCNRQKIQFIASMSIHKHKSLEKRFCNPIEANKREKLLENTKSSSSKMNGSKFFSCVRKTEIIVSGVFRFPSSHAFLDSSRSLIKSIKSF